MADTVESEADRLGRLIFAAPFVSCAWTSAKKSGWRMEMLDLGSVVRHMADQYARRWPDRRISVVDRGEAAEATADPELFRLALSQLLDNACKYSTPGTAIDIVLKPEPDSFLSRSPDNPGTPYLPMSGGSSSSGSTADRKPKNIPLDLGWVCTSPARSPWRMVVLYT